MCMKFLYRISFYTCLIILTGSIPGFANDLEKDIEKEIVKQMNEARQNPKGYVRFLPKAEDFEDRCVKENEDLGKCTTEEEKKACGDKGGTCAHVFKPTGHVTQEGFEAVNDAIKFLEDSQQNQKKRAELRGSNGMSFGAQDHVADIGPKGLLQHKSSSVLVFAGVDQGKGTFTVPGDQTGRFTKGVKFTVTGFTADKQPYKETYTVKSSEFDTATSIVVNEAIQRATADGQTPLVDITNVDQGKGTFTVAGDQRGRGFFTPGFKFTVTGFTAHNQPYKETYTVKSSEFDTATSIVVNEAIQRATAGGNIEIISTHRDERYGRYVSPWTAGENIGSGPYTTAREFVVSLIIDDGVPNRGHREIIFTPEFCSVGVACGDHKAFGKICVITFATAYQGDEKKQEGRRKIFELP